MDAAARESINRAKAGQEADLNPNEILKSMAACLVQDNSSTRNS